MFETLTRLYAAGKGPLTVTMLSNAVIIDWITDAQKQDIVATKK